MPTLLFMNIDPIFILILGMILFVLGIVLSFAGRKTWHVLMVLIGGSIGALFGLFIGYYYFGWMGGLVGALIGSFVVSQLFRYIAESAVPFGLAILVFLISYVITNQNIVLSACIAIVVMILAFFIVDVLLSLLTAAIGAILSFFGIVFIGGYYYYPPGPLVQLGIMFALALFFMGLIVQMLMAKEEREALRKRFAGGEKRKPLD
jgi:hypothetical protein